MSVRPGVRGTRILHERPGLVLYRDSTGGLGRLYLKLMLDNHLHLS